MWDQLEPDSVYFIDHLSQDSFEAFQARWKERNFRFNLVTYAKGFKTDTQGSPIAFWSDTIERNLIIDRYRNEILKDRRIKNLFEILVIDVAGNFIVRKLEGKELEQCSQSEHSPESEVWWVL